MVAAVALAVAKSYCAVVVAAVTVADYSVVVDVVVS